MFASTPPLLQDLVVSLLKGRGLTREPHRVGRTLGKGLDTGFISQFPPPQPSSLSAALSLPNIVLVARYRVS